MKTLISVATLAAGTAMLLSGCASPPSDAEISARATAVLKASFAARGQAGLDRLDQDDEQIGPGGLGRLIDDGCHGRAPSGVGDLT